MLTNPQISSKLLVPLNFIPLGIVLTLLDNGDEFSHFLCGYVQILT